MTLTQAPPPGVVQRSTAPAVAILVTDLACLLCNRSAGVLVHRPTGLTLERADEPVLRVAGIQGLRCLHCRGNITCGEVTSRRERPPEEFDEGDYIRRGRPPRWLVQLRAANKAASA